MDIEIACENCGAPLEVHEAQVTGLNDVQIMVLPCENGCKHEGDD